jgi:methanogenic corrinoid protein MtbC1
MVYPFLEKIGVLWLTDNITPAQEHFITNLIRQKIIVAIDALPLAPRGSSSVIMFLPEQELHELGLLFYYYITKKKGFRVYYLGQMVPYRDVVLVCKTYRPSILITSITTSPAAQSVQRYLDQLCSDHPDCTILASGHILKNSVLKLRSNLHLFFSAAELNDFLG